MDPDDFKPDPSLSPEENEGNLFNAIMALAATFKEVLPSQRIATTVESVANPIRREEWEASR